MAFIRSQHAVYLEVADVLARIRPTEANRMVIGSDAQRDEVLVRVADVWVSIPTDIVHQMEYMDIADVRSALLTLVMTQLVPYGC